MISFNKKDIFIVTGASSGIGKEVALRLNSLGATVIAIARNTERLLEMKNKCEYPENTHLEQKDLGKEIDILPDYVKELKNRYGKLRGLAYCAGVTEVKPVQILDVYEAKKMFDVNYFAPLFMVKGFIDKRNNIGNGASVVVISSIAGIKADRGQCIYAGSKAAIAASMKAAAREAVSNNVRINCVSPADIKTPMVLCKDNSDFMTEEVKKYPLGFGEVDDVANMIIFLLSDKAKWITTQNYVIDCGYM